MDQIHFWPPYILDRSSFDPLGASRLPPAGAAPPNKIKERKTSKNPIAPRPRVHAFAIVQRRRVPLRWPQRQRSLPDHPPRFTLYVSRTWLFPKRLLQVLSALQAA